MTSPTVEDMQHNETLFEFSVFPHATGQLFISLGHPSSVQQNRSHCWRQSRAFLGYFTQVLQANWTLM